MKIRDSIKEASIELLRDIKEHPWKYDTNDEESKQIYEEVCEELRRRTREGKGKLEIIREFLKYLKEPKSSLKEEIKRDFCRLFLIFVILSFFAWICIDLTEPKEVYIEIPYKHVDASPLNIQATVFVTNPTKHFIIVDEVYCSIWSLGGGLKLRENTTSLDKWNISIDPHKKGWVVASCIPTGYALEYSFTFKVRVRYRKYDIEKDCWSYSYVYNEISLPAISKRH